MKKHYKGFELSVERVDTLMGEPMLECQAIRESDKWILDYYMADGPVKVAMQDLVFTVEDFLKNPQDYEDELDDEIV